MEWIILKERDTGMRGAVVTRGILGYGRSNHIHASKLISLSEELPLSVEIVDEADKVKGFAETVRIKMEGGLVTVRKISVFE